MNKYKINELDGDSFESLALGVIQQAVEDIKHSAELFEYYIDHGHSDTYNRYTDQATMVWGNFVYSGTQVFHDVKQSNVIDLSFHYLDNAYDFWITCLDRIEEANTRWSNYYSAEIDRFKEALERVKI